MTDLDTRLDRIESELAIRRLAAEYCHGADKRDLDRFLAVWAPDAVWRMGDEVSYEGHEAIAEVVRAQWTTFAQYVHWTTNHSIWIDGDHARGECDVAATVRLHSGRWVRTGGTYRDEYRRVGGQWFIAHRDASARFDIDAAPDASETRLRFDRP
ncbi:nuclear transport factor 2 family protein [Clavibacter sp. B3I6]|uniref:nuclear transport factor 2 family protein n=1 Tax=Clavibacter sp. B3I6 TaxID=3042268 RepID=UPI0027D8C572|nr:nuclear transport factor 2 family protein [Clavibacter sp. B3I6]